jgi:hypothetical protein
MDTPTPKEHSAGAPPAQPKARSRNASLTGFIVCLLVAASVVAWYFQASPLVVARRYVSEQQGIAPDDLELVAHDSQHTNPYNWFGAILSETTVEFRVNGPEHSKKRVVELFRPIYFLPWRVSALKEGKE